jgi:hypothetical protein
MSVYSTELENISQFLRLGWIFVVHYHAQFCSSTCLLGQVGSSSSELLHNHAVADAFYFYILTHGTLKIYAINMPNVFLMSVLEILHIQAQLKNWNFKAVIV